MLSTCSSTRVPTLMTSCRTSDNLTFARALVERGADINARMTAELWNGYRNALNGSGRRCCRWPPASPRRQLRRALIALGADPEIPNAETAPPC